MKIFHCFVALGKFIHIYKVFFQPFEDPNTIAFSNFTYMCIHESYPLMVGVVAYSEDRGREISVNSRPA